MDWTAVGLTLQLATATSIILLVVGVPLAYWLAMSSFRGRFLIEAVTSLPLVLPPTVLGFYILLAVGPDGILGKPYGAVTGQRLSFSFAALLLGAVLANLPFALRPFTAAFTNLDRNLIEAAWCLGQSRWQTFRQVVLPLVWPGLLSGVVLTFAHTIGEFGVVLMVGGNVPGVTRTLSMVIYDDVQALDFSAAHRTALVLLTSAFVLLCVVHVLGQRRWAR